MKKKLMIMGIGLVLTASLFAFNYNPNTWTTCIFSGTYVGGGEVGETGYFCIETGEQDIENQGTVAVTECLSTWVMHARPCVGNGPLHAYVEGY